MKNYLNLLERIVTDGHKSDDRTGVGTIRLFGTELRFNLASGDFPLITCRDINFKLVVGELLWMLSGSTDTKVLKDKYGVGFWTPWAKEDGTIGPMYGRQLRDFNGEGKDQLKELINKIKIDPTNRRLLMTTLNPLEVDQGVLWPCHGLIIHFNVNNDKLNLLMYQRSADAPIGVPFNIAFYALLLHIIARLTNLKVGEFVHVMGDTHIYLNQLEKVKNLIKRYPKPSPKLIIEPFSTLDELTLDHFRVEGYNPHPKMSIPVAL